LFGFLKKALVVFRDALVILFKVALAFVRVLGVAALVLLVAAFALAFALYGAGYFHSLVRFAIEKYTGDYTRTECRVGRVEGTLLTGLDIYDFALADGPSLERDGAALVIDEIHVRYDPLHFIRRDVVIDRVRCVRPRLILKEDPDGGTNLARIFGAKGPPEGKGVYFEIDNVYLEDAYFKMLLNTPLKEFTDADIECKFTKARGAVFIDLRHCSCYLREFGQRVPHFGSGSLAINARLMHFSGVDVASHSTRIRTDGTIKFEPQVYLNLRFQANPLDIGEVLQGVFADPPEFFGRGRYAGTLVGTTDRLKQSGALFVEDAHAYGLDMRDAFAYYEFDVAGRQLHLSGFEGRLNQTPTYAKATFDFTGGRPVYWGEGRLLHINLADYVRSSYLESEVDVRFRFSGSGVTADDYALDASLYLGPGRLGPVRIEGGNADLAYAQSRLLISGLSLRFGDGELFVKGSGDRSGMDFEVRARGVPLEGFAATAKLGPLGGSASFEGRVAGPYKHPSVEGGLVFKNLAYGRIKCDSARVEGRWENYGADERADVRVMAWDLKGGPLSLARVYADVEVEGGVYEVRDGFVESTRGDVADFDLAYDKNAARVELSRLELNLGGMRAGISEPMTVSLEKDRYVVGGGALKYREGDFSLRGSYKPAGGALDFVAEARDFPLGSIWPGGSGPSVGGTLDHLRVDVTGTTRDPSFYANFAASNLLFNGQPIDYVRGEASYEKGRVTVPGIVGGVAGGTLRATAYLPLSLFEGRGEETLDATLWLSKFNLNVLASLAKPGLVEGGYVDGVITASGTSASPVVRGNLLLSELRSRGVYFAKGRADFTYRDRFLAIREFSLSESTLPNLVVSGRLPLDLRGREASVGAGAIDVGADFVDLDLRAANFFTDEVLITGGKVRGRLELRGTYENPLVSGRVAIAEGEGVARALRSNFSQLTGDVETSGERITVGPEKPLTFKLDEGRGEVWGYVAFEGIRPVELELTVNVEDYVIRAISGVQALGNVRAHVAGPVGGLRANADVKLTSGLITIDFGGESPRGAGAGAAGLDYEVRVVAPGNLWLRNKDAEIEFEADVTFRKAGTATVYTGQLRARRGTYYFLKRDFTVEEADISFTGTEELNPVIKLRAKRVIRAVKPENADAVVYVDVTGTLRKPELQLSYEEGGLSVGLTQDEIMKVLALDVTWNDYNALSTSELASKGSSDYVRNYAEAEVARAVRRETGVDVFRFDANVFAPGETNPYAEFTVGQHLTHDLFVSYTGKYREEISGARELEHSAEVDYELRRNLYVVGSTYEEEGSQRYGLGLRFIHKY
jgi:autotransporter translocation and assembly factor TamB